MKAGRDIELGMGGGMVGYREPESKDQTYIMLQSASFNDVRPTMQSGDGVTFCFKHMLSTPQHHPLQGVALIPIPQLK